MKPNASLRKGQLGIFCLLATIAHFAQPRAACAERRYSIDDLLRLEDLGAARFSPDGRWLALETLLSASNAELHSEAASLTYNRALFIVNVPTGEMYRVAVPGADGIKAAAWSPDSRYLLIETADADRAEVDGGLALGVWEIAPQGYLPFDPPPVFFTEPVWVSNTEVVYSARNDERPLMPYDLASNVQRWRRSWLGKEPSYSILESGVGQTTELVGNESLVRVDVTTGRCLTLANGHFGELSVSPDRAFLIARKKGPIRLLDSRQPVSTAPQGLDSLVSFQLQGERTQKGVPKDYHVFSESSLERLISWSPDGKRAIFFARKGDLDWSSVRVYEYIAATGELSEHRTDALGLFSINQYGQAVVPGLNWFEGSPALLAPLASSASAASVWRLDTERPPERIAGSLVDLGLEKDSPPAPELPQAQVTLAAGDAHTPYRVYRVADRQGKRFVLLDAKTRESRDLLSVNTFLQEIDLGSQLLITYSLPKAARDSEPSYAWYLTPPGYRPGQPYPTIVYGYGGLIQRKENSPFIAGAQDDFYLNPFVLAAEGYVVLKPSLPIDRQERPLNIPQQLAVATEAAVDRLIEIGVADPERLAILGHSYGGYTALSVLGHTHRFKAAMASAGVYNMVSNYGEFRIWSRYAAHAAADLYGPTCIESGWCGPWALPWEAPETYVRNSPLFLAGRIDTPVLFLHGDLDGASSITESEQMFRALYRQGKRARFIRLWGEGHDPASPASKRLGMAETLRWLKTYL